MSGRTPIRQIVTGRRLLVGKQNPITFEKFQDLSGWLSQTNSWILRGTRYITSPLLRLQLGLNPRSQDLDDIAPLIEHRTLAETGIRQKTC